MKLMALSFCGKRILTARNLFTSSRRHGGYIVLVPEIGEESTEKNPLLRSDGLPEFTNISIENCTASIAKQTLEFENGVDIIEKSLKEKGSTDIFKDIFDPLEELGPDLDLTWGLSKTLYLGNSSLMPTKSYLAIHDRAKRARASKYNSQLIYDTVKKELSTDGEGSGKSEEQVRVMQKFALEGRLNGLDLKPARRAQLQEQLNKLTIERVKFKQKIEVATNSFKQNIDDSTVVRDFPKKLLEAVSENSAQPLNGPWKITLQPKVYLPALEYCPDRLIRWNIWQALVSRGSGYTNRELITSTHLEEIRGIRRDISKILGFETFADMSMVTKMAGSTSAVKNMLSMLLKRAKPAQDREIEELYDFATDRGFNAERLELWDVPYWRRKQVNTLYNFKEADYNEYFPLSKVLEGLFQLSERLLNIVIKRRSDVSTWHKDVKFFDIFESHSAAPVAGFYLDPYARHDEKIRVQQGNGWMVGIQNHSLITGTKPLAALIFNFEPPTGDKPSLLSFREVKQLFHKFGQALQHLLTRTTYSEVSGLSNVEWDAVEVCGHVFTHWLLNKSVMDQISSHCDSEDKLPQHMFESLVNAHKHLAGLDLCKEIYLSALDLELHSAKEFWLDIVKQLWEQHRSFPLHKEDSHPCSFTQIFTEEWAAAYYSHLWSRMVAADVYSAFHEVQGNEKETLDVGKRFRDTFLALGGSRHPSQVFRQFRGRDPSPKALLTSLGLKKSKSE